MSALYSPSFPPTEQRDLFLANSKKYEAVADTKPEENRYLLGACPLFPRGPSAPPDSIRNHTVKLAGYNIWDDLLLPVTGKDYSLNTIEQGNFSVEYLDYDWSLNTQ